jgi:hypothetical protein
MRRLIAVLLTLAFFASVQADTPQGSVYQTPPATLLQRLLQEQQRERTAQPLGSCIFFCGDRLIEVERCPSGECPEFDCNARVQACPTR